MKLGLTFLVFFCALVPQVRSLMDPTAMLSVLNPDLKLPPTPPRSLFPGLYRQEEKRRRQVLAERRNKEMQIFRRLKSMTPEQVRKLQESLPRPVLHSLIQRLKYLKHQERLQNGQQQQQQQQGSGTDPASNTITSGANRIRQPGGSANSVGNRGGTPSASGSSGSPQRQAPRRRMSFMQVMQYSRGYMKESRTAMTYGCGYPLNDPSSSFFASFPNGCSSGSRALCYSRQQTCVVVKKAAMCCPPGFTSATLEAMSYMKQMQAFMSQFQ